MSQQLLFPQGTLFFPEQQPLPVALALAGGRRPAKNWLQLVGSDLKEIYAADKGLDYAAAAGLKPSLVIGDGDSARPDLWDKALSRGVVREFSAHKDQTDLQLLLAALPLPRLYIFSGILGGRFDHLYSAVLSLAEWCQKQQLPAVIADEKEIMVLMPAGQEVMYTPPEDEMPLAVSVLPFLGEGMATLNGVVWPLSHEILTEQDPYAISNRLTEKAKVDFICEQGILALYIVG